MGVNALQMEESQIPLTEKIFWGGLASTFASSAVAAAIGMTAGFNAVFWFVVGFHYVALLSSNAAAFQHLLSYCATARTRFVIGGALLLGLLFLGRLASFPVTATDALVHHLAVPKWWLAAGRIHNIPWHEWSFYPMSVNIGYLVPLSFNAPRFAAVYHLAYWLPIGALTGMLAVAITRNVRHAFFAAYLALTLPLFLRLASIPLVDLGLTTACVASFVLVARALQQQKGPIVVLLGLSLGAVISSKLNGILFLASLCIGWLVAAAVGREVFVKNVRQLLGALSVAALCFAPWGLKNYLDTGNPIFPLYRGLLGGPSLNLLEAPAGLHPLVHRQEIYGESIFELLLLPVRMIFFGQDDSPRAFDGVLTPIFLFAVFPLFQKNKSRALTFSLLTVIIYVAGALIASGARARYLCPILPAVCVLAALPITTWVNDQLRRSILVVTTVLQMLWVGKYGVTLWTDRGLWPTIGASSAEDQYLSRHLADYSLIHYTNVHLLPNDRVYLLGTSNRFFLFDRPVFSRGYYSMNEIISWIRTGSQPDQLAQRFVDLKVTHLFVGTDRLKDLLAALLTPEQGEVWNRFSREHLDLVRAEGSFSLWRIKR